MFARARNTECLVPNARVVRVGWWLSSLSLVASPIAWDHLTLCLSIYQPIHSRILCLWSRECSCHKRSYIPCCSILLQPKCIEYVFLVAIAPLVSIGPASVLLAAVPSIVVLVSHSFPLLSLLSAFFPISSVVSLPVSSIPPLCLVPVISTRLPLLLSFPWSSSSNPVLNYVYQKLFFLIFPNLFFSFC